MLEKQMPVVSMRVTFVRVSSIESKKSSIESENSSINSTFYQSNGKVESTSLSHFNSLRLDFLQRQWKSRIHLTFSLHFSPTRLLQRQWKSRVHLTFSLHFCPTRLFTTAMEKSSLPHFLTSLLSDSTFYNGNGKVESTSLSLTSLLSDSIFTTAMEKSSLPHFLTSLLSDSTFYNGSGKVESTSLSHFTSLRLDFSQRQWKSRVYLTF